MEHLDGKMRDYMTTKPQDVSVTGVTCSCAKKPGRGIWHDWKSAASAIDGQSKAPCSDEKWRTANPLSR